MSKAMFENLEARLLLAGDVTVTFAGGSVVVKGDNLANVIAIQMEGDSLGVFGGTDTRINGKSSEIVHGFNKNLTVIMNDGNDTVRFDTLDLPKNLNVQMGKGTDTVNIITSTVAGNTNINGADSLDVHITSPVGGGGTKQGYANQFDKFTFNGGKGENGFYAEDAEFGTLSLNTGNDDDTFNFYQVEVSGDTTVNAGNGYNSVGIDELDRNGYPNYFDGNFTYKGGSYIDELAINYLHVTGITNIDTGAAFKQAGLKERAPGDVVNVTHSLFEDDFNLSTGAGRDGIDLNLSDFEGDVSVMTFKGDDNVWFDRSEFFGYLSVGLGAGNDNFTSNVGEYYGGVRKPIGPTENFTFIFDSGVGDDNITIIGEDNNSSFFIPFIANFGDGADDFVVNTEDFYADVFVNAGAGNDTMNLTKTTFTTGQIDGRAGSNSFSHDVLSNFGSVTFLNWLESI